MRRFEGKGRRRVAALIAVVLFHLAVGLLLIRSNRFRKLSMPNAPMVVTFLPPSELTRSPVLRSAAESTHQKIARGPMRAAPTQGAPNQAVAAPQVPEPSHAITAPNVNWDNEAAAVARGQLSQEEAEKRRKNLAGPSDDQLDWARKNAPLVREHHEMGDMERAEGGQLITWVNDKCYWTTPAASWMSQTTQVCKDPPKPDEQMFKDMQKQLDSRSSSPSLAP